MKKELKKGMNVRVFDGDFIGWTTGSLVEQYSKGTLDRWSIETTDKSLLVRYIKIEYNEMTTDGCGYLL